jgi:hypothetical protein
VLPFIKYLVAYELQQTSGTDRIGRPASWLRFTTKRVALLFAAGVEERIRPGETNRVNTLSTKDLYIVTRSGGAWMQALLVWAWLMRWSRPLAHSSSRTNNSRMSVLQSTTCGAAGMPQGMAGWPPSWTCDRGLAPWRAAFISVRLPLPWLQGFGLVAAALPICRGGWRSPSVALRL